MGMKIRRKTKLIVEAKLEKFQLKTYGSRLKEEAFSPEKRRLRDDFSRVFKNT